MQNPDRIGYFIYLKTGCKWPCFKINNTKTNTHSKTAPLNPSPTKSYPTHHSQLATSPSHPFPTHLPPHRSTSPLPLSFHPQPLYPSHFQPDPTSWVNPTRQSHLSP